LLLDDFLEEVPVSKILCLMALAVSAAICLTPWSRKANGREKTSHDPQTAKLVASSRRIHDV
jgi:hypothetical protein